MLRRLRFWIDDLSTREALMFGGKLALGLIVFSLAVKLFSGAEAESRRNAVAKPSVASHRLVKPATPELVQPSVDKAENERRAELFDQPQQNNTVELFDQPPQNNTAELFDPAQPDERKQAESLDGAPAQDNPGAGLLPAQILFGPPGGNPAPAEEPEDTGEMNQQPETPGVSGQAELFGTIPR